MIDHPRHEDEAELRSIWKEVFNDTDEFIGSFFGRRYSAGTTLVYREGGRIASMIFFPHYDFRIGDDIYGTGYICGAATLPQYRNRGLMGLMIEASHDAMRAGGKSFSTLIPASDTLYEYYRRFGYREKFFRKRFTIRREDIAAGASFSLHPVIDYGALYRLYASGVRNLPAAVIHTDEGYRIVADEFLMSGGHILVSDDQRLYCFVRIAGDAVSIRELFGESVTGNSYTETASALLDYFPDISNVHVESPVDSKLPDAECFRTGMARGLSPEDESLLEHVTGAYMKFMLED